MISRNDEQLQLQADDVDDVLYAVRSNDKIELDQVSTALATKHSCSVGNIFRSSIAEDTGNTPLHFAAANGLADLLAYMLTLLDATESISNPPDLINRRNNAGNTALHWSALNGHLETTQLLVESGADLWTRNAAGNLAVFEAERAGKDDVVAYLLQVGGKENEKEDGKRGHSGASQGQRTENVMPETDHLDDATEAMATTKLD